MGVSPSAKALMTADPSSAAHNPTGGDTRPRVSQRRRLPLKRRRRMAARAGRPRQNGQSHGARIEGSAGLLVGRRLGRLATINRKLDRPFGVERHDCESNAGSSYPITTCKNLRIGARERRDPISCAVAITLISDQSGRNQRHAKPATNKNKPTLSQSLGASVSCNSAALISAIN